MLNPIEGEIFCIDKPLRMTSFAAVKKVRAVLRTHLKTRQVKVGHAGTLDPLATGVLLLCTGHATKRIDELQAGVKEYIADLRLGATTPSYDLETEVDATYEWRHIDRALIDRVLQEQFTGSIEQVPPSFSACKIDGKPAYKLARRGQDVEIRPKTLVIDEIEVLQCGLPEEPTLQIRVVCSKGTYIRALARDIGMALDSGAHLTALRRTRVGDITIDKCLTLEGLVEKLDNETYVSPEQAAAERLERERIENRERAARMKAEHQARKQEKKCAAPPKRTSQIK
ncbi:MAG: tRNA pseudouridine(55) synthase TruB [Muribaculaceae bacterium]|nr:tRNA pseudouridine(55) synthase TruB [Muribaculaceae bacterium]